MTEALQPRFTTEAQRRAQRRRACARRAPRGEEAASQAQPGTGLLRVQAAGPQAELQRCGLMKVLDLPQELLITLVCSQACDAIWAVEDLLHLSRACRKCRDSKCAHWPALQATHLTKAGAC